MSGRFDGKVAFVTGATSGIGRATALAFAREGASVVVADVAAAGNEETARMIEQTGGQTLALSCDVARGGDIQAALRATVERFGRLDIAFNNAGIEQPIKAAAEIGDGEWDRLVAVNLRGAFLSMKSEIELMLPSWPRSTRSGQAHDQPGRLRHRPGGSNLNRRRGVSLSPAPTVRPAPGDAGVRAWLRETLKHRPIRVARRPHPRRPLLACAEQHLLSAR